VCIYKRKMNDRNLQYLQQFHILNWWKERMAGGKEREFISELIWPNLKRERKQQQKEKSPRREGESFLKCLNGAISYSSKKWIENMVFASLSLPPSDSLPFPFSCQEKARSGVHFYENSFTPPGTWFWFSLPPTSLPLVGEKWDTEKQQQNGMKTRKISCWKNRERMNERGKGEKSNKS